jgi:alkanesulfonate monooxygenase SsuD/methylene tetrahydromethanopterin reductase-like flavin-dependent oxidoreductase (luciferase family)
VWTNDVAHYHGDFVRYDNAVLRPAPTHGTVPIIVGGDSRAAMRRAARLGDGWYGWWAGVELEPHLAQLRAILAEEGREEGAAWSLRVGLPVGAESPDEVAVKCAEAERLGVDELVLGVGIPTRDFDVHLKRWAEAVADAR